MSESGKRIRSKKYSILRDRLEEENPKIRKESRAFLKEVEKTWTRISPFVGEEEAYGRLGLSLSDEQKIKGVALDYILWFVLFKKISEKSDREFKSFKKKIDKELKWFKENREFLQMMLKEYLKEKIKPSKKKEPTYRA